MIITINAKHFKALLAASGKKDVLYYLNGVCVDVTKNRAMATDGHRCLITPLMEVEGGEDYPNELIFSQPNKAPAASDTHVTIEYKGGSGQPIMLKYFKRAGISCTQVIEIIDGKYPEVDRVMPEKGKMGDPLDCSHFNPMLIVDVQKALGARGITLTQPNGVDSAYRVEFYKMKGLDFCIMPMRP